ncbi:transporter substrate-binding domain-containing protein [Olivibacter sp. SDN3]|nr:transporter substrate-binding domain-containing protein [Olivibacter sp. SDN3]
MSGTTLKVIKPSSKSDRSFNLIYLYFILLLNTLHISFLCAQETGSQEAVKVGVYVSPPFVMEEEDGFTGMSIELWEALAEKLGLTFTYERASTFSELVEGTADGRFDVAVTNLTVTQNRARKLDFTQPWYDAGLRIMVDREHTSGWTDVVRGLSDAGHLRTYAWLAFLVIFAAILLTLFDRKFDKNFPRAFREGFAENFYHIMSLATSGKAQRKNLFGWKGRIFSGLWLVCGVGLLAYITSSLTSVMTTQSLTNRINGIGDLPGKRIGVFMGSESEKYTLNRGFSARAYQGIEDAIHALKRKEIDAIIGDAPVLEYYQHTRSEEPFEVVGPLFKPDKYGFGFIKDSELTTPLTIELLGAHERGFIEKLRNKYFGQIR